MRAEVPSMAMGDIAFILLIFFVILAKAQDDSHVQWKPAAVPTVQAASNARVSVAIDKDAKLFLNGKEIGVASLSAAVSAQLGNAPAGQRMVLLKVDRDVQAQRFEPVIEAIGEAGGDLFRVLEETK